MMIKLDFSEEKGLLPAIVQDYKTGRVLRPYYNQL